MANTMARTCGCLFWLTVISPLMAETRFPTRPHKVPVSAVYQEDFEEWILWDRTDSGMRAMLNFASLPTGGAPRKTRLLIYATPNGNTLEQTLGCKTHEGQDWHFDIQHIMAQTRLYRRHHPSEEIVLAVVQAAPLSWPAFRSQRKDANREIATWIQSLISLAGADRLTIAGHSGGGSFMFGLIESSQQLPDALDRLIFLDANYSFDESLHGPSLRTWLGSESRHSLSVIAYDDREITFNGKKVVGPAGGTFRATERMLESLRVTFRLNESTEKEFKRWSDDEHKVEINVHPNLENKILHTALVGEMNGFVQGLTFDTPAQSAWGIFGGPRAYSSLISSTPFEAPLVPRARMASEYDANERTTLQAPQRPDSADTAGAFLDKYRQAPRQQREAAILQELTSGNMPTRLRKLVPIEIVGRDTEGNEHTAVYFVTPDYLMIGSDQDSMRVPMNPDTANQVAQAFHCILPTRKICDDLWMAATKPLKPHPLTESRESLETFAHHHRLIEAQLGDQNPGRLVVGIKKDVVTTPKLQERPNRVAIYGWHEPNGCPIQPLYLGHVDWYVDYSHGVRLVADQMIVDDSLRETKDVLADPRLWPLLSDEGI